MELRNNCTKNENQSKEPHKRQAGTQLGSSRLGETGLQGRRDRAAPAPPGREASAERRRPPGPAPELAGGEASRYRTALLPFHHPRPGPMGGCELRRGQLGAHAQGPARPTALANGGPGHRGPWGSSPPRGERTWRGGCRPLELAWSLWLGNLRVSSIEVAI